MADFRGLVVLANGSWLGSGGQKLADAAPDRGAMQRLEAVVGEVGGTLIAAAQPLSGRAGVTAFTASGTSAVTASDSPSPLRSPLVLASRLAVAVSR